MIKKNFLTIPNNRVGQIIISYVLKWLQTDVTLPATVPATVCKIKSPVTLMIFGSVRVKGHMALVFINLDPSYY